MYPIIKQFDSRSIDYKYIHTGQHYDYNLFLKFIEEFEIREPDICISADVSNPVNQVANIMEKIGIVINELRPSLVLVEGDTNSVLASALAALKSKIPIAHIESGLRSNDCKTDWFHSLGIYDQSDDFILVTIHRAENVDDINVLRQVLMALSDSNLKYIFPIHPHTLKRIQEYGLGNQIGKERPESVESGHSFLCKIEYKTILEQIERLMKNDSKKKVSESPYGSGDVAVKIIDVLIEGLS